MTCAKIAPPGAAVRPQCDSPYYVATASFVVVLVFSDPAFPPRSIHLFDGLELLDGANQERHLTLSGVIVPTIPRGEVSLYTIEGDVHLFGDSVSVNAGRGEVALGKAVSPAPISPISCGDASLPNWENNMMDSSIVLDPSFPEASSCVRGVDIDAGNEVVRRIKHLARGTATPGVLSDLGSFGGMFALDPLAVRKTRA